MAERTILVVEDEATIAGSVAARLRKEGFAVEIAGDGPSAVRRARDLLPDLVILGFSLLNPDGLVAARNIQRLEETGRVDLAYLGELSADALPALAALPRRLRASALDPHEELLSEPDPWPAWNLGRARARALLEARAGDVPCPGAGLS